MSFPIDITQLTLENTRDIHNKFYELMLVRNAAGKCTLIKRYGKKGAFGELKIASYPNQARAEAEFEKVFKEKTSPRKGYSVVKSEKTRTVHGEPSARMAFGPALWPKLPPEFFANLDLTDVDVSRRRPLAEPRFDEDVKFVGDPAPRTVSRQTIEERLAEEAAIEQKKAMLEYEANPDFGAF
jgi:predicted DNA-binding WGR domain protein